MDFKIWFENEDYRGTHKAPTENYGAPLYDLTNIYPEDVYGPNGARYYGHGDLKLDKPSFLIISKARNNPDYQVEIYRAIPNDLPIENQNINSGDWVTINKKYAILHGESTLQGQYKIITKIVPAKTLYTDGNSIHEWGYNP